MNELSLFSKGNVPAFVRERSGRSALAEALESGSDGKSISIRGGVFRLVKNGKEVATVEERYLDVVIVAAAPTRNRVLYLGAYDPESKAPPACWSADGVEPSPDAVLPQSKRCDSCPKNIAGSGQGDSRACRYQQHIAVVLANDVEGDVLRMALPAMSIFGSDSKSGSGERALLPYAAWLGANNVEPMDVVTRMRFDTSSESPKLLFKAERFLTDEEHQICAQQAVSPDALSAVKVYFKKGAGTTVSVAPTQAPQVDVIEEALEEATAPATQAAPQATPAPTIRNVKATPVPAPVPAQDKRQSLKAAIEAWTDD